MSNGLFKEGSPSKAVVITPSDTALNVFAGIYVGGAGNIALSDADGNTPVTFTAVPVGSVLRVATSRVLATGTTATLLIGLG